MGPTNRASLSAVLGVVNEPQAFTPGNPRRKGKIVS